MLSLILVRANFLLPKQEKAADLVNPRIIFPFYPRMENETQIFERFENETANNETFTTLSVDCLKHRTYCAKYNLQPGKISVSIFDHEKPLQVNKPITEETLNEVAELASNGGYYNIDTQEKIDELANKGPLFLFVARKNAGDLTEKKPIFAHVAASNIGSNINFGYVTDSVLYEKYANYPYIAFTYVAFTGKHYSFRGKFNTSEIQNFINIYSHPILGKPVGGIDKLSIAVVGNEEFYEVSKKAIIDSEELVPTVYVNSTGSLATAEIYCKGKYQCLSLVNFKKLQVVPCGLSFGEELDKCGAEFEEIWNSYPLVDRLKTQVMLAYSLYTTEFTTFICCTGFLLIFLIFFKLDSRLVINY